MGKILISYFSASGVTKRKAEELVQLEEIYLKSFQRKGIQMKI